MAAFNLLVSPLPANYSMAAVQTVTTQELTLHATTPLRMIRLAQTQQVGNNHQFQLITLDNREWYDLLDGTTANAVPGLIRESQGQEFTAAEWQLIEQIRQGLYTLHNQFLEPTLIQMTFLEGLTTTIDCTPTTVAHGAIGALSTTVRSYLSGHLDWIGLYPVLGPSDTPVAVYQYLPDGVSDVVQLFDAPAAPGTYEFRYMVADSLADVARSLAITVT